MNRSTEYIIGIDLGTTNSIVAYIRETSREIEEETDIRVFPVPQLIGPGTIGRQEILPSFLLIPDEARVSQQALQLPWNPRPPAVVGEFARDRGVEIPTRLISSSKSWLCHTQVDRTAPILPWEAKNKDVKRSPVEASAEILKHMVDAWNHEIASPDGTLAEHLRMESQEILLTVPASFDAVARELTVAAAEKAGLRHVTLLEEPQAACYAWIDSSKDRWREAVRPKDLILVCDIGGGTTDFSLIRVGETDGELNLERIAVGDHLLVGGDNMDLALGYAVAGTLAEKGTRLDAARMRALSHACRKGKEKILSDETLGSFPITLLGQGKGLISGTIQTTLDAHTVHRVLLEGFFPVCDWSDTVSTRKSIGIQEMGLSYESDPAITKHLAEFLRRNSPEANQRILPTAVLFNGGVMKSARLRNRIMTCLKKWGEASGSSVIRELETTDMDRSVARGAVYYGLAKHGKGIRIRSGLNKTYYIGIAASMPAVPGIPQPIKALCIAPFGMEEGTRLTIEEREFGLVTGEPAKFDFMGSSTRKSDTPGEVIESWEDDIDPAVSIEAILDGTPGEMVPVALETRATEIGTLEIWCISRADDRQWRLEFQVREAGQDTPSASSELGSRL